MRLIKRLDIFVLSNFLMLFAGTFCISLFVVMMQFLWKYVDEIVGKGLSIGVMAQFFFYAGETLVPLALPLAILLASLISFGNMGERLELLAIKAAGISLIRTMAPIAIFVVCCSVGSFYFQNNVAPNAEKELMTLLYSMRQKSPESEITERVFQQVIDGYNINIYVGRKDKQTGMLYDVIIYDVREGVSKSHIIVADSGKIEVTSTKRNIRLTLHSGEQFENLQEGGLAMETRNVPYRRETFVTKVMLFDVDMNFNMEDSESFATSASTKNMGQLLVDIDSMETQYDSIGRTFHASMAYGALDFPGATKDATDKAKAVSKTEPVNLDTLLAKMSPSRRLSAVNSALQRVNMQKMDTEYHGMLIEEGDMQIRRHWIQVWQKITMSLACLVFFFIGAPLGAIIRKGGLGLPVVVSVIIFIFYYIVNTSGMKVGREGSIPVWLGMWMSTFVLAPIGVFFTVKSNNDSVVFNLDSYRTHFRRLFGIRTKRNIVRKEVIIHTPDYLAAIELLKEIMASAHEYLKKHHHISHLLGYAWYIVRRPKETEAIRLSEHLEYLIEGLSNSKDRQVLLMLNGFPILEPESFRFYRRRRKDMKRILKYGDLLMVRLEEIAGVLGGHLDEKIMDAVAFGESLEDEPDENYD